MQQEISCVLLANCLQKPSKQVGEGRVEWKREGWGGGGGHLNKIQFRVLMNCPIYMQFFLRVLLFHHKLVTLLLSV